MCSGGGLKEGEVNATVVVKVVAAGVDVGLDVVDGIPPMAGSAVDDGQSIAPSSIGEGLLDGCEDGTPSGDSDSSLGLVDSDSDAQGWSCGKGALALIHPPAASCSSA